MTPWLIRDYDGTYVSPPYDNREDAIANCREANKKAGKKICYVQKYDEPRKGAKRIKYKGKGKYGLFGA